MFRLQWFAGIMLEKRMKYNFDEQIDRRNSGSVKWNKYAGQDIVSMWIADMDLPTPPPIIEAMHKHLDHGLLGYTEPLDEFFAVLQSMLQRLHNWNVEREWIIPLPTLVPGLHGACRAVCAPGEKVITCIPVYGLFFPVAPLSGCSLTTVPLAIENNKWKFDVDQMSAALTPETRMLLFCNPHNPVGRMYSRTELEDIAGVCEERDLVICSDEIHCDLILDEGKQHIPTATLSKEIADRTITLMSPGKTYNLGGMNTGFAVISNPALRKKFQRTLEGITPYVNMLGITAMQAAYSKCEDWYSELIPYLRGNRELVFEAVSAMRGLSTTKVEATYLAWIDVRGLDTDDPVKFFEDAGVGLFDGNAFGTDGFLRLNFACPRPVLKKALNRMHTACSKQ